MKDKLVEALNKRVVTEIAPQSSLKFLKGHDVSEYFSNVLSVVYMFSRPQKGADKDTPVPFVEMATTIGHSIRNVLKMKKDSAAAVRAGAFMLWSFEDFGIFELVMIPAKNKHASYALKVLNDDAIIKMWESLSIVMESKLPSETPYEPWTSAKHICGENLVKTADKSVLEQLTPESHPLVFHTVNAAQKIAWRINKEVFDIQAWALKNKTDAFADIWEQQNPEAKATKLREAKAIGSVAKRFLHKNFYHLYQYDFRGRKYPATAYLHEQGSDLARGLIRRVHGKQMGAEGFEWLMITLASNWAGDAGRVDGLKTDKIPLKARYDWAVDHEDVFLSYAEAPKKNQGWMAADSPWQFLAACFELRNLRLWQMAKAAEIGAEVWEFFEDYTYVTAFEAYIDGSNNGSQHLTALTRDEETAPHVNLVPSEYPGDLYKFIGDQVWDHLADLVKDYTEEDFREADAAIEELIQLKRQIQHAEPRSERRKALADRAKVFKESSKDALQKAAPVFWLRIIDAKHKRKVVKRNVMTLPYGGTSYGLGQQIIDDSKKHGIELLLYLEHKWGAFLGREVFETCKKALKKPMQLLAIFEAAGKAAEERGEFLQWIVPVTNFPVVQHYTEGEIKKVYVQYGPPEGERLSTGYFANTLQLNVCHIEKKVPSKGKQSSGASPNCIHSLDAAHLSLIVWNCDFDVTTIHDSFGCLLPDMPKLYRISRESFVELYASDPLTSLMNQIGGDISKVEMGNLDLNLFLESEYGFV